MHPIFDMLMTLVIGTVILMLGILMSRDSKQNFGSALQESMAWGIGFFFTMGLQIVAISVL